MQRLVGFRAGVQATVGARSIGYTMVLLALALSLPGCQATTPPAPVKAVASSLPASEPISTNPGNWPDVRSHAEPLRFVTRSYDLDLEVDFETRQLRGTILLELDRVDPQARELVLDTRDLKIASVEVAPAGGTQFKAAEFALDARDPVLGSALRIAVPLDSGRVRISYATSPQASGLQWLQPVQTAGTQLPFVYSQSQALHARSIAPLQDTPWIRSTFTATLRVPAGLVAVMAAEGDPGNRRGQTAFRFRMPQPIPSYLLAFAVGDLEFRALGPRTGIWAEPSMIDAAVREFEDVEAMLARSEALWGPYLWGRYDVLVLPPSFPWGAMENPRLTFMTPVVIAGDKSLVGILAHELAHSWSGNLVTNATWRDGWLNEGFTTYFERRIMEAVYGEERARMEWGVGHQDLREELADIKPEDAWQSELAPDLAQHPDWDGSTVAYEKGALFLYQLEQIYGRAQLDAFLRGWFQRHAFTSVTTPQFVGELQRELMAGAPGRVDPLFLSRWIDGEGLPEEALVVRSEALDRVDAQRLGWEQGSLTTGELAAEDWSAQEWLHFLDRVSRPLPVERLQELDARFHLTESQNAEVAHAWFRIAIASGYPAIAPTLERYLVRVGRLKLIRPLYKDLLQTPQGAQFAHSVYARARPGYHPITQDSLDSLMKDGK